MKILIALLVTILLSGCATATWKDSDGEKFTLTTLFKTVDGFSTQKGNGVFWMKIDKTGQEADKMMEMMRFLAAMQAGQVVPK